MSDNRVVALPLLKALRLDGPRSRILLGSAGAAALAIVLRYLLTRSSKPGEPKLLRDLSLVGTEAADDSVTYSPAHDFDVIVVGGGTSGCVLASRLSEDPSIRVLLIEAGGSGKALAFSRMPSGFGRLLHSRHDYDLTTEPQVHANGSRKYWPRAKMLGGCSSINAQMAQYGSPGDFDQWADTTGDPSYRWREFSKYFRKFEHYSPDPKYPMSDTSVKGTEGPIRIGFFNHITDASRAFIKACINLGIPSAPDFNGPNGTMGVGRVITYVDQKGQRVSSESAYLTDDVLARPNLRVVIHAQVTRVLFETQGEVKAVGVEFATGASGPWYRARARKEVILSAGAVHSPHILMLSGIGPAAHLQEHGIDVVADMPGVGANLVDHPVVDLCFKDRLGSSVKFLQASSAWDTARALTALAQYKLTGTGPIATNFGESAAFVRSDDPILFPKNEYPMSPVDSTPYKDSPDLEYFCTPLAYKDHGAVGFDVPTIALHVYLLRPTSTGEIRLWSSDPWQNPSINPNYLKTPEDLEKLVRGVRLGLRMAHKEPLSSYLDHTYTSNDLDHQLHTKSDAELVDVVKERVETVYHPTSSCRMAKREDGGVVDAQMRVYGIKGLRVCDASVFPYIVSGHTAGACLAIAEKLADEIKREVRLA